MLKSQVSNYTKITLGLRLTFGLTNWCSPNQWLHLLLANFNLYQPVATHLRATPTGDTWIKVYNAWQLSSLHRAMRHTYERNYNCAGVLDCVQWNDTTMIYKKNFTLKGRFLLRSNDRKEQEISVGKIKYLYADVTALTWGEWQCWP